MLQHETGEVPRVKSAARTVAILLAIADAPEGLTARQVSEATEIGLQSTYQFLQTLRLCGFLRNNEGRYVLGLAVGKLVSAFSRQLAMPSHLEPVVRKLALKSGETVYAAGWWQGEIIVFASERGSHAVSTNDVPIGLATDGHARASGKYLLAHASPSVREAYLAKHRLNRRTDTTITNRDALRAEFERIKSQGYATDLEEFSDGVCCVARSVAGLDDFVLVISAPRERFELELDDFLRLLKEC